MKTVIVVGGGIAGLVTAVQLARAGISVILIEKRKYPSHRVCGEYISNEAAPFLKGLGLYPYDYAPPSISRLQLTSVKGDSAIMALDSGGFGISRFSFDQFLCDNATASGVTLIPNTAVENISFNSNVFLVKTMSHEFECDLVIGAFGKRSTLDTALNRDFMHARSPYLGVKYHIRWNQPPDLISLHNFNNGYCGMSRVENGIVNLCYLSHRDNLKQAGSLPAMERQVLHKNPFLKAVFTGAEFLFAKPEVINEISFETKAPVERHVLMVGDSAGMITPLCGNGMAMALRASQIASKLAVRYCMDPGFTRESLEHQYAREWRATFAGRLWTGRQVQRLFGADWSSSLLVRLVRHGGPVAQWLVSKTHGRPF